MTTERIDGYLSKRLMENGIPGIVYCQEVDGIQNWELRRGLIVTGLGPSFQAARHSIEALIHSVEMERACETDP